MSLELSRNTSETTDILKNGRLIWLSVDKRNKNAPVNWNPLWHPWSKHKEKWLEMCHYFLVTENNINKDELIRKLRSVKDILLVFDLDNKELKQIDRLIF